MKKSFIKNVYRTILSSFGRYVALILIVMLGVIFYVGLKITTDDMIDTTNDFYNKTNLYDCSLISTIGFDIDAPDNIKEDKFLSVEGAFYQDFIITQDEENERVLRFHSITEKINKLDLVKGRMPENISECVVDSRYFNEKNIGETITISDNNSEENIELVKKKELTIVGLVNSPLYLSYQRGTTKVGSGQINSFAYVKFELFDVDYYKNIYIDFDNHDYLYSDAYNDAIDEYDYVFEKSGLDQAIKRLDRIYDEKVEPYRQMGFTDDMLPEKPENPSVIVQKRIDNLGYSTFKDNADIVASIAYIFPIFFVLVAALVCITTMSRMIEDERTQIGVFKALGYSYKTIFSKYIFYSLSASIIGGVSGFYLGSYIFPSVIWKAYMLMYTYTDHLNIIHDYRLLAVSLTTAILVLVGSTLFTCGSNILEVPASLIRPKAPQAGKRILLERIKFIWSRLKFSTKISLRNCFRYKKRFFMMLLGIAGCTALVIIGFGIKDSISSVCNNQYDEIETYDYFVVISDDMDSEAKSTFEKDLKDNTNSFSYISRVNAEVNSEKGNKSFVLVVYKNFDDLKEFINFKDGDKPVGCPDSDKVLISRNFAESINVSDSSKIKIEFDNLNQCEYEIANIYDNFVNNYVYMSEEAYLKGCKENAKYNCLYAENTDADIYKNLTNISNIDNVISVSATSTTKDYFNEMVSSLNGIVYLVIACAAILAFVVLYNLNNINIMERTREIATIKVLGFFKNETNMYVFRENLILTFLGILCGMPLGYVMHGMVMDKIKVDMICFDIHINPISYVYSAIITVIFSIVVDIIMRRKVQAINMSDSLKAIE